MVYTTMKLQYNTGRPRNMSQGVFGIYINKI